MSIKIIMFLSLMGKMESYEYTCPDGSIVNGAMTNEAPLKYLLSHWSGVSEILCIVTDEAHSDSWEYINKVVNNAAPGVKVSEIPFNSNDNFESVTLPKIMEHMSSGDEILLETTGGFRNAIMYLLLLSRALSYSKIATIGAVYSNFEKRCIEDVSHLIRLFDLIGGMQELTSFGSVKTLRSYYGEDPADKKVGNLITSVEKLSESIALCRTDQIEKRIQAFNDALKEAENCDDAMMKALLPAFISKYGKKMTVPGLIKWCVESDMLQQALTIYTERVPAFIIKNASYLKLEPNVWRPEAKEYQDAETAQFIDGFMRLSQHRKNVLPDSVQLNQDEKSTDWYIYTVMYLERFIKGSGYTLKCPIDQMQSIMCDYLYIKALRNMTNHANSDSSESQTNLIDYLIKRGRKENLEDIYVPLSEVDSVKLRKIIIHALENLKSRRKRR